MREQIDRLAAWWFNRRQAEGAQQIEAESGVKLQKVSAMPGEWRMDLIAPNLMFLIDEAAAMLNAQSAENYIQFDMLPRADRTQQRMIRVTIQWANGESPAEQNARLRAEVERFRAAAEEALSFWERYLDRTGAHEPWARVVRDSLRDAVEKVRGRRAERAPAGGGRHE